LKIIVSENYSLCHDILYWWWNFSFKYQLPKEEVVFSFLQWNTAQEEFKKNETNKQPYLQTTTTKSNGIRYFTNHVSAEDKHVRVKF